MIFHYSLRETRQTIELFAADRDAAALRVLEIISGLPYDNIYDPSNLYVDSEGDYRIISHDR